MYYGGHLLLYLLDESNLFQIHDISCHIQYVSSFEDVKDPARVRDVVS
jgi:hypothetical protein